MSTLFSPRFRAIFVYFFVFLLMTQTISCNYYRVNRVYQGDAASFFATTTLSKYFVVHQAGRAELAFTNIQVDSTHLLVQVQDLDRAIHYFAERPDLRYRVREEKTILHEVHVYLANDAPRLLPSDGADVMIPYEDIKQIDIINPDTGKTVASYIFTGIAIGVGVFAIVVIIAILTKSSCPYVYVHDGEDFVFQGETFGGAIMENMARDDYMPLPMLKPVNGSYQLRITNELKERQYTDLAQLMVVYHESNQKVLLDQTGHPQVIQQEVTPVVATTFSGVDVQEELATPDRSVLLFNEVEFTVNGTLLTFDKPAAANSGKVILRAKNSLWLDYLYGELAEKFGERYEAWMAERAEMPTEERLTKLLDNDIPLSIYLKRNNEWERIEYLPTVGPLAARDFVIPLDLSAIEGEQLELKIETGFMFWELDYVAMDFTENTAVDLRQLPLISAIGTNGIDWRETLQAADETYMEQLTIGEVTQLEFVAPQPPPGKVQTTFLHTRGYYELIRDFAGPPQLKALNKFKTPGYFAEFSRAEYLKRYEQVLRPALVDMD